MADALSKEQWAALMPSEVDHAVENAACPCGSRHFRTEQLVPGLQYCDGGAWSTTEPDWDGGRTIEVWCARCDELRWEEQEENPGLLSPSVALSAIVDTLSGKEWTSETLDIVADLCRAAGREIKEPS